MTDTGTADCATIEELSAIVAGTTAPMQFVRSLDEDPDAIALRCVGAWTDDVPEWRTWTFGEYAELAGRAAAGLRAAGVRAGDRVLLMMRNRPDFHWFDLAVQLLRATPVSIYNSSSPEEVEFLARSSAATIAVVEHDAFLGRVQQVRGSLVALQRVYVIEPSDTMSLPPGVDLAAELVAGEPLDVRELAAATHPDDIATLIYTSGTTGPPKGVMISQRNVVYTVEQLRQCLPFTAYAGKTVVSYLPMAHIAERMMSHYIAMQLGFDVTCCPETSELPRYLTHVRPSLIFGVPRVWEKIHNGVLAAFAQRPDGEQFRDGVAAALEIKQAEREGAATAEQRDTWAFLDAVAFAKVRELVGLDRVEVAVSGAAPIQPSVLEWFNAIGVPLSEIYGMSESSGPMTWSPEATRPGTVGRAIPGSEVAVAPDGEVIYRGGNVFQGYLDRPEETARTLVDGWLHSGDIGELDGDGYLRIVDRKKELIITSGGKNISPANLEMALKNIPLVGQAAAIGDNRKFVTAILVLDPEAAASWAAAHDRGGATPADLASDPDVLAEVQAGVDEVNAQFAQVEQIKRFTLLGEEWQPDSDVLTPTSKLKRRGIASRYEREIERMYGDE